METAEGRKRAYLWLWISILSYAAVSSAFLAISWRKWPDAFIDYGLQLYTPWQLSEGKVLGRDVMYLAGGPLSQYFHAILFKLFGVSFTTLIVTSLCLIALFTALLHSLFVRAADHLTATIVCLLTLGVFAFGQYSNTGNYNYVCPYTYEAFHGLILSVATIGCLWRWLDSPKRCWAFGAGLGTGAVFLTKPDLFLALAVVVALGPVLRMACARERSARGWVDLLWFIAGVAVPVAAFAVYYAAVWEWKQGLAAVAGAWVPVLTTPASHNAFYRWSLGLDEPVANLRNIALSSIAFVAAVCVITVSSRLQNGRRKAPLLLVCGLISLALVALSCRYLSVIWAPALGPATLFGTIYFGRQVWRTRPDAKQEDIFALLWSLFALFLLAKMGLNTRIWHYGFYLAMPASAFLVYALLSWIPRELKRFHVNENIFRAIVTVCLVAGMVPLALTSVMMYRTKYQPIAQDGDRMMVYGKDQDPSGVCVGMIAEGARQSTSPTNTLAVLPSGVMINYLSRRTNPTRFVGFSPPEVQAWGETNMLDAYRKNPPDYIVLAHSDPTEYGFRYFGQEARYGLETMAWIRTNYTSVGLLGVEPLKTNQFGIQILRRNDL